MADEEKFQQLKGKYVSLLNFINRESIQLHNLHEQGGKLVIRGTAPSEQVKNGFWQAVKKVDADYTKDLMAEIDVKPAAKPAPAPAAAVSAGAVLGAAVSAAAAKQETYTVVKGDTLSKIAKKFYGDANQYMKIFEANRDQLKDPDKIQVGQVLKIPAK